MQTEGARVAFYKGFASDMLTTARGHEQEIMTSSWNGSQSWFSRDSGSRKFQPSIAGSGPTAESSARMGLLSLDISPHQPNVSTDSPFKVQQFEFYKRGRVFAIARENRSSNTSGNTVVSTLDIPADQDTGQGFRGRGQIYVVIQDAPDHRDCCHALQVITYGHQGVSKAGVVKADHGIIYSGRREPLPLDDEEPSRGEEGMCAVALRVEMRLPSEKLDPMSRVNYKAIYMISKTEPVHNLGMVHRDSVPWLLGQLQNVQKRYLRTKTPARREDVGSDDDDGEADNDGNQRTSGRALIQPNLEREAKQAKDAYNRMLRAGYTREQALRQIATVLQNRDAQLSWDGALNAALGRLRVPPNPINV